jgi:hypothetical protein
LVVRDGRATAPTWRTPSRRADWNRVLGWSVIGSARGWQGRRHASGSGCDSPGDAACRVRERRSSRRPGGWQRPLVRIATQARRGWGDPHVASVDVYSTTARAFTRASNQADPPGPDQDVYVLVLHGHFTCRLCSRPPGTPALKGTMAACVLERRTLRLLEFGFGGRLDVRLLGRVQTLALP